MSAHDSITVFTIVHYCAMMLHLVYTMMQQWTGLRERQTETAEKDFTVVSMGVHACFSKWL